MPQIVERVYNIVVDWFLLIIVSKVFYIWLVRIVV